jgi:hypothetical protein
VAVNYGIYNALKAISVIRFFAHHIIYDELDIFKEIELIWAIKFRVGSKRTPRNFITGIRDRLPNSINFVGVRLGSM